MITSYLDFLEKFNKHFKECWDGEQVSKLAGKRDVRWQGQDKGEVLDNDSYTASLYFQTVSDSQATLADCVGIDGVHKHYKVIGFTIIDLFIPKNQINSYYKGLQIASLIKNHFRKGIADSNIFFKEIRFNEHGQENLFYRCSIVVEFEYYEYS